MNSFREIQKFKQWWLWVIVLASLIAPVCITLFGKNAHKTEDLLVGAIAPVVIILLIYFLKLTTQVDEAGIHYKFSPLHLKTFLIEWNEIDKAYIRQYKPILEYGGWGLRAGLGGVGRAYNVSGNMGLQLELKTGKKILFGTQKPDEINKVLNELVKNKVIERKVITQP